MLPRPFTKVPTTIALLLVGIGATVAMMALAALHIVDVVPAYQHVVERIDFSHMVLHWLLGPLLFAGALHVDAVELRAQKLAVGVLALGGTLLSTLLIGAMAMAALGVLGIHVEFVHALLFGAILSPTDPVAVLGMLKRTAAPAELETRILGESLFNDGIGVVLFVVLAALSSGGKVTALDAVVLLVRQVLGGAVVGLLAGWLVVRVVRVVNQPLVAIALTTALVVGGYVGAEAMSVSAPLMVIVAGLRIGTHNRNARILALDHFWHSVDHVLNAVLFLLVGCCAVLIPTTTAAVAIAMVAIVIALVARLVSVAASLALLKSSPHSLAILTWGGLRGGLSLAMALAVPAFAQRNALVVMTYAVVVWTLVVQGLTFSRLLRWANVSSVTH